MGINEIEEFLSYLVSKENASSSTQNQALSALLFLYKYVIEKPIEAHVNALRAKKYNYIPTVLTVEEVHRIFKNMSGTMRLIAELTYGSGMRISETHNLRIQDIDFSNKRILVRDGKGRKDRFTVLPDALIKPLHAHLLKVKQLHINDLASGHGLSVLPSAHAKRKSYASRDFIWQFVFPSNTLFNDESTGNSGRWHINVSASQKNIQKAAISSGIMRRVSPHTLRHSFATHLLQNGCDIRKIQSLLGHTNITTTMIYAHIVDALGLAVVSPLDSHSAKTGGP